MADLRLITILPQQSVSGVPQPQITGNSTPQGTLGNLQPGSILSGFIINRDSGGNPILRTEGGDITFASNFFLKIGSEITIRIEHIAGSNSAHILTVNGQPPEVAVQQSGFAPDPDIIVSDNLKQSVQQPSVKNDAVIAQTTTPSPTITVTGTVISQVSQPNAQQNTQLQNSSAPPLPLGTQLSLKIINLSPPVPQNSAPQTAQPPIANPAAAPFPADIESGAMIPASPSAATQAQPSSTPVPTPYAAYARANAATPANITTPETITPGNIQNAPVQPSQQPQTQNAQQITATVISNDPNGEAIINTPLGIIRLQAGTQLPIGSHVTFEISEIITPDMQLNPANNLPASTIARTPAPLTELARSPSALGNIFALLSGLGTEAAQDFITRSIPTAGQPQAANATYNSEAAKPHNLISALFNYASAVSNGDFRGWLGKANAKWLEDNGHDDLLRKAEGEFASISRQFTDALGRSWQSLFFPIAIDGELQQARLFVKRDRKQKEGGGNMASEEDTRFVVEMDLTQLGEMQMDGFVRNNSNTIHFDLIIRSNMTLSQEIQKDILGIYNNVGELTGYQGSLAFQTVKEFPVNPMEEIISAGHEGVVA